MLPKKGRRSAIRLFSCRECGHRMRFMGLHCGACYASKAFHQSPVLMIPLVLVLLTGLALLGLVLMAV